MTLAALDQSGNPMPNYTGTVHFTSTDPGAALPADHTFTAADHGVHTFTGVLLVTAGTQTLTATDAGNALTASASAAVTPAAANHFGLSVPPGVSFDLTVTALDPFGNVATGYNGEVHFTSWDHAAVLPDDYIFTAADQGVHTFPGLMLETPGVATIMANDLNYPAITGQASSTLEFAIPTADSQPVGITNGPDGALWFTEAAGNQIGRITLDGTITNEYPIPTANSVVLAPPS